MGENKISHTIIPMAHTYTNDYFLSILSYWKLKIAMMFFFIKETKETLKSFN